MPFDLETAIAVRERPDGLLEKDTFDLASAQPITEISMNRDYQYVPALTEYQKGAETVRHMYKERGEKAPIAQRVDWQLNTPQAEAAVSSAMTFGSYPIIQGIRGSLDLSLNLSLIDRIFKGIYEPEKTKRFYKHLPGTKDLPLWAETIANIAEDTIVYLGFGKAISIATRNMQARSIARNIDAAANALADEQIKIIMPSEGGFLSGEQAQAIKMRDTLVNGFRNTLLQKLSALEVTETGTQTVAAGMVQKKNTIGMLIEELSALGEAGRLKLPKVGQVVNFTNKEGQSLVGTIKEIMGQRAIIDMEGRQIVATLSQLSVPEVPQPQGEGKVEKLVPESQSILSQGKEQFPQIDENKILENARIIAGKESLKEIKPEHIAEAIQYEVGDIQGDTTSMNLNKLIKSPDTVGALYDRMQELGLEEYLPKGFLDTLDKTKKELAKFTPAERQTLSTYFRSVDFPDKIDASHLDTIYKFISKLKSGEDFYTSVGQNEKLLLTPSQLKGRDIEGKIYDLQQSAEKEFKQLKKGKSEQEITALKQELMGKYKPQIDKLNTQLEKTQKLASKELTERAFLKPKQQLSQPQGEKIWSGKTGIPHYDAHFDKTIVGEGLTRKEYYKKYKDMSGDVVQMSPSEYMELAARGQWEANIERNTKDWGSYEKFKEFVFGERMSQEKLGRLKEELSKGEKLDIPSLEYDSKTGTLKNQEGYHRAKLAQEMGIEKIPVMVVNNPKLSQPQGEGKIYHGGTAKDLKSFKVGYGEFGVDRQTQKPLGIYFSDKKEIAKQFGDNILEAIKPGNLLDLSSLSTPREMFKKLGLSNSEIENVLGSAYTKDAIDAPYKKYWGGQYDHLEHYLTGNKELFNKIKSQYDGIKFLDKTGGKYHNSYVLFEPSKLSQPQGEGVTEVGGTGQFDVNVPIKAPEGTVISAVELDDGRIFYSKDAKVHAQVINDIEDKFGISPDNIKDGGFITADGRYVQGGADAKRIGKIAKAKEKVKAKLSQPQGEGKWSYGAEPAAAIPGEPIAFYDVKGENFDTAKAQIIYDEIDNEPLGYKIVLQNGQELANPKSDKMGGSPYFETMGEAQKFAELSLSQPQQAKGAEAEGKVKITPEELSLEKGRLAQLETEIKSIDKQMSSLEEQKTRFENLGKSTRTIDTKLEKLSKQYNYIDSQIAEILTGTPVLAKEKISIKAGDFIKKIEQGIRKGIYDTKENIANIQTEAIKFLEEAELIPEDKGKLLRAIKNIQNQKQLEKFIPKVIEIQEKAERSELTEDLRKLFRKEPKKIPIEYKDLLADIKSKILLKQRGEKGKTHLESMRQFVERMAEQGEEINIPEEKLALLEKISIDEMTTDELRDLKETITRLYHQGKLKNKLLTALQERKFDDIKTEIINNITKGQGLNEESSIVKALREQNESLKNKSIEHIKNYIIENMRPELMLNMLDGGEPGFITNVLFDTLWEAQKAELQESRKVSDTIKDIHKGLNFGEIFTKKYKIGRFEGMTKDNALFIYANSFNESNRLHLIGSGITDEDITTIEKFLSNDEKRAVKDILRFYDEYQYPILDNIYIALEGVHLGKEEDYYPIDRVEDVSFNKELEKDIMERNYIRRPGVSKGFTKERVSSNKGFSEFSYFGTILRNNRKVEHYKAFAKPIRDANKILSNHEIKSAIKERFGDKYYQVLDKWLKDVAYGGDNKTISSIDKISRWIRTNYVTSVLGGNLLTAAKQPISFLQGAEMAGKYNTIKATLKFLTNPFGFDKLIDSKSVLMDNRRMRQERELGEIMAQRSIQQQIGKITGYQAVREGSMLPIVIMDKTTCDIIWLSAYEGAISDNLSEKQAINHADMVIRRTQPMSGALNLPDTFRGPEYQKFFTLFRNQPNQNFNLLLESILKKKEGKISSGQFMSHMVFYILVPSIMLGVISRKRLPEDFGELAKDILNGALGGLIYLGNFTNIIAQGFMGTTTPLDALLADAFRVIQSKEMINKLDALADIAAKLSGLPYMAVKRIIRGEPLGKTPKKERKGLEPI